MEHPGRTFTTWVNRFNRWRRTGYWARILEAVSVADNGDVQMIDSSSVWVHQHAANGQQKTSDPVACAVRATA